MGATNRRPYRWNDATSFGSTRAGSRYARPGLRIMILPSAWLFVAPWVFASCTDAESPIRKLETRYDITIQMSDKFPVATTHGKITGRSASDKAVAKYVPILSEEFRLYPPSLIERSRLQRIVLCEELAFAGQRRTAIPDFEHDTLYLDVARGRNNETYLRLVIHHEFFHIIDYRDDGALYRDADWSRLNSSEFSYGEGGETAQDNPSTSVLTEDYPGFLNHYSTTSVAEDKAEMFAVMVVKPSHVARRAERDAIIRLKAERLRALLKTFCPDMDGKFWKAAGSSR